MRLRKCGGDKKCKRAKKCYRVKRFFRFYHKKIARKLRRKSIHGFIKRCNKRRAASKKTKMSKRKSWICM